MQLRKVDSSLDLLLKRNMRTKFSNLCLAAAKESNWSVPVESFVVHLIKLGQLSKFFKFISCWVFFLGGGTGSVNRIIVSTPYCLNIFWWLQYYFTWQWDTYRFVHCVVLKMVSRGSRRLRGVHLLQATPCYGAHFEGHFERRVYCGEVSSDSSFFERLDLPLNALESRAVLEIAFLWRVASFCLSVIIVIHEGVVRKEIISLLALAITGLPWAAPIDVAAVQLNMGCWVF